MPKFKTKGLPDFSKKIQTALGEFYDRSSDLVCHLRANPDGTFFDLAKNLQVSGSGTFSPARFKHNNGIFGPAAIFNGVDSVQGLTGSVPFTVPATGSHFFTNTAGGAVSGNYDSSGSGIRAGQGSNQYTTGSLGNHLVYPYETYFHTVDGGQSVGFDLSDELTIVDGTPITEMHLYFQAKFDSDLDAESDIVKISWMSGSSWSNTFVTASSGDLYKDNNSGGWTKIKSVGEGSKFISFDPAQAATFTDNTALADDAWRWYKLQLKNVEAAAGALDRFTFGLTAAAGEQFHISNPIIHSPNNDFGTETNNYLSLYPDDGANVCISAWINLGSLPSGSPGGRTIISQTHKSGTDEFYGTTVYINSNGQLGVRLHDRDNSVVEKFYGKIVDINRKFALKQWYHFVIIVNNTGLFIDSNDDDAFQIYINGESVGLTSETGSGGEILKSRIRADGNRPISIGFGRGGYNASASPKVGTDNYLDASLAEISIWRSLQPFGKTDANAIWKANKSPASGIIGLPQRASLIEKDTNSSRPPNMRPYDQRRLGNNTLFFDDTRASIQRGGQINYPSQLHQADPLLESIYRGYLDGGLTIDTTGSSIVYQDLYTRQDEIQHKGAINEELGLRPFDESRIFIVSGSDFYDLGTPKNVIPGFEKPLKDKHQISFIIEQTTDAVLGSTSDIADTDTPKAYMRYVNFDTNNLDQKGGIAGIQDMELEGSVNQRNRFFQSSSIGFGPMPSEGMPFMMMPNLHGTNGAYSAGGSTGTAIFDQDTIYEFFSGSQSGLHFLGRCTDGFGFPSQELFATTDGQSLDCSTIISAPFLLEKITIDLDYDWVLDAKLTMTQYSPDDPTGPPNRMSSMANKFRDLSVGSHDAFFFASQLTSFVLRETTEPLNETFTAPLVFGKHNAPNVNAIYRNTFAITGSFRELVGYGQATAIGAVIPSELEGKTPKISAKAGVVGSLGADGIPSDFKRLDEETILSGGLGRETNIIWPRSTTLGGRVDTQSGHLSINYTPKPAVQSDLIGNFKVEAAPYQDGGQVDGFPIGISSGFAFGYTGENNRSNTVRNPSTRPYNAATFGKVPPDNPKFMADFPTSNGTRSLKASFKMPSKNFKDLDRPTPYLIMPNDKLIFGFQLDPPSSYTSSAAARAGNQITIKGPIRIQLFGSYLENALPKPVELNQMLTNDIVYESIGEPIFDEFDIEPPSSLTGSYVDDFISGSHITADHFFGVGERPFYQGYQHLSYHPSLRARDVRRGEFFEYLARRVRTRHSTGLINPTERQAESLHAKATFVINAGNLSNAQTVSITFGAGTTAQVITMNSGAGTDSTSFAGNAAALYLDNNANANATAASIATLANSVAGFTATSNDSSVIIISDVAAEETFNLAVASNPTLGVGGAVTSLTSNGGTNPPGVGIRGSLARNVRMKVSGDRILDTVLPSIVDIWKTDIVTRGDTTPTEEGFPRSNDSVVIFSDRTAETPGSHFIYTHDAKWPYAFPFEHRYQFVSRTDMTHDSSRRVRGNISIGFQGGGFASSSLDAVTTYKNASWPADVIHYSGSAPVQIFDKKGAAFVQPSFLYYGFPDDITFATLTTGVKIPGLDGATPNYFEAEDNIQIPTLGSESRITRSILFGIGEGNRGRYIARRREFGNDGFSETKVGYDVNIRGFKYGLMNANPMAPSCVFRRDRYGQFRDMLEMSGNYAIAGSSELPVDALFYNRDGTAASNPSDTSCSNLSTHMTSSAPFFDRDNQSDDYSDITVLRNRPLFVSEVVDVELEISTP